MHDTLDEFKVSMLESILEIFERHVGRLRNSGTIKSRCYSSFNLSKLSKYPLWRNHYIYVEALYWTCGNHDRIRIHIGGLPQGDRRSHRTNMIIPNNIEDPEFNPQTYIDRAEKWILNKLADMKREMKQREDEFDDLISYITGD